MGRYDRAAEDVGNIVFLEHVNTRIPDQQLATLFYVSGLGLTRDPYLQTGVDNMWVNVGRSQFHLPTGKAQVLRGHAGLVLPDREQLVKRLTTVCRRLEGTQCAFEERDDCVEVTGPWGNRFRCYAPGERFAPMSLGIPYVELDVPEGAADGIARFYASVFRTSSAVAEDDRGRHARVSVGADQYLLFRETDKPPAPYDGHHIAIYLADFSGPYRYLLERGLITEESDQHQYRFLDIVDPDSGKPLFRIEHEVRSMRHPLYARRLVNRNPDQSNVRYAPGYEDLSWSDPKSL
ncbi:MAG TPA: hypothetical protein VNK52_00890 [Hyphomicrobiaceae bacterium]|nr:hypothetical protein [Hyphomicrobiaceae bacterium]